jgi:hypothetical protein
LKFNLVKRGSREMAELEARSDKGDHEEESAISREIEPKKPQDINFVEGEKGGFTESNQSSKRKRTVVFDFSESIDTESEDGGEESFVGGDERAESRIGRADVPTFEVLPPHLPNHMIKGQSKRNLSKGKHPMNSLLFPIQGDLVPNKNSAQSKIFDLTEESIRFDRIERIRNTLKTRIVDLNERKLYTLEDVIRVFLSESVPLSLKLPIHLSSTSLATLLLIEETSDFVETLRSSIMFQDSVRRCLLEEKNLPVCRCGYIYVHPSLTYSRHPRKKELMIGNMGDIIAVEHTKTVLTRLNALRFFLEILFTTITTE